MSCQSALCSQPCITLYGLQQDQSFLSFSSIPRVPFAVRTGRLAQQRTVLRNWFHRSKRERKTNQGKSNLDCILYVYYAFMEWRLGVTYARSRLWISVDDDDDDDERNQRWLFYLFFYFFNRKHVRDKISTPRFSQNPSLDEPTPKYRLPACVRLYLVFGSFRWTNEETNMIHFLMLNRSIAVFPSRTHLIA